MYHEILVIENYCKQIGVETKKIEYFNGFILKFNNGADVVQHGSSYRSKDGFVEFGHTGFSNFDFRPCDIQEATSFIKSQKDKLNKGAKDE